MTDASKEAVEVPRYIYAFSMKDMKYSGTYVRSIHATLPRWEGDEERDRDVHKYIDGDIYDSQERYYKQMLETARAKMDINLDLTAAQFQNALRIMYSLDEVADVIGAGLAVEFHRDPYEFAMRMDEPTFAKVYALIEARQS